MRESIYFDIVYKVSDRSVIFGPRTGFREPFVKAKFL